MTEKQFNSFDIEAMNVALAEAKKAKEQNEVPVGAAVFIGNELIATAHNEVESKKCASKHAELLALQKAAKKMGDFRLSEATLYTTLEPCAMCAGAIYNFRIKKVVYGAKDLRVGACGTLYNLFDGRHPITKVEIVGGLKEKESAKLLRDFFKKRREENDRKNT